jgi:hypothetical protein
MPFTARDLRYRPEQSYPVLYAYLHRNAQRYLGSFKYDAFEVDTVIGHVVEQLVRLGLLAGGDTTPLTALDRLSDAQFYAFLSRCVRNKAIDRLRKRRLPVSTVAELEMFDDDEQDNDPLDEAVNSLWGSSPFSTPEAIALHLTSQQELRAILKHCIMQLNAAPQQLLAVIQEMQEFGADDLLSTVLDELRLSVSSSATPNAHQSQHKDHAHKKLRLCLQQHSSHLTVIVALRLTLYKQHATDSDSYFVALQTLAQDGLSEDNVKTGLSELAAGGLLTWHGEDTVHLTSSQLRRLLRFYREE